MPTTLQHFESVFPSLIETLLSHCKEHNLPDNALTWFREVRAIEEPLG